MATTTTPSQIRKVLAARIVAAGLREATGPLGAEMEPSTTTDRSFDLVMGEDGDAGQRVVPGQYCRLQQAFTVHLAHSIRVKVGPPARDRALEDKAAVMRCLLNRYDDALGGIEAAINYQGGTIEDRGGGAYLLTSMRWVITYQLDLTAGVP